MKTLTVKQPHATLLATGDKRIETRSWVTSYRGPVLIHASSYKMNRWEKDSFKIITDQYRLPPYSPEAYPNGVIVGVALLTDCVRYGNYPPLTDQERALGFYGPGRVAWLFKHAERFKNPIPALGYLGLWDFDISKIESLDFNEKILSLLKES